MMFLNNLIDDGQTQSRSFMFSALVLGREEWVENMFEIRLLDSPTRIFDFDVGPDVPSRLHDCRYSPPAPAVHPAEVREAEPAKQVASP